MLKRMFSVVLTLMLLFTMAQTAYAAEIPASIVKEVEKTNDFIYDEIKKAQDEANKLDDSDEVKLNKSLDRIIAKLLEKTESAVDKVIEKAAKEGVEIEKQYIEVQIRDRVVFVDPCYAH